MATNWETVPNSDGTWSLKRVKEVCPGLLINFWVCGSEDEFRFSPPRLAIGDLLKWNKESDAIAFAESWSQRQAERIKNKTQPSTKFVTYP